MISARERERERERERDLCTYYDDNGIMPVSQHIDDKHFNRRAALYRLLGVPPLFLQGKSVIEFGAGTGHNALFTLSCKPSEYFFVDGSKTGLDLTQKNVTSYINEKNLSTKLSFFHSLIENFSLPKEFDLVCCEGLLQNQKNPEILFSKITQFQRPGGIVIITCFDAVSSLSDMLRRLMGLAIDRQMPDNNIDIAKRTLRLIPFFKVQFENLKGMSRPLDEWILDNVFSPDFGVIFSIYDALKAAKQEQNILGCSPHFFSDWRWYKDITDAYTNSNEILMESYQKQLHNFLDYQYLSPDRSIAENAELLELSTNIYQNICKYLYENDSRIIADILSALKEISVNIKYINDGATSERIGDALQIIKEIFSGNISPSIGSFKYFFGRGQQYISFVKV